MRCTILIHVSNQFFKFNLPALFVQWQSILADTQDENLHYKSTVPEVLNKWLGKTSCGRIIIIGPKTKNDKGLYRLHGELNLKHAFSTNNTIKHKD